MDGIIISFLTKRITGSKRFWIPVGALSSPFLYFLPMLIKIQQINVDANNNENTNFVIEKFQGSGFSSKTSPALLSSTIFPLYFPSFSHLNPL